MNIADAYRHCESIVRMHSSSFYRAFSILPAEKRNAVWAVYGFCRTVDDLVDEHSPAEAEQLLTQFNESFQLFLEGTHQEHPVWIALQDTFNRYPMDISAFQDMIAGQQQDLVKNRYATLEELDQYCYLVAGTVGLMLLPILTPVCTHDMKRKAIRLGQAMQITNILRDVREDWRRGRVYLPQDRMNEHGYNEQSIPFGMKAHGWDALYKELYERAEAYYEEGLTAASCYPRDSRIALIAAALIYREILTESKRRDGNVFQERIRISGSKKISIVLSLLTQPDTWKKHRAEAGLQS